MPHVPAPEVGQVWELIPAPSLYSERPEKMTQMVVMVSEHLNLLTGEYTTAVNIGGHLTTAWPPRGCRLIHGPGAPWSPEERT